MRLGSGTSSLARFLSSASWSLAPGPCEAPVPVTILTFPCQDGFCSRDGPLSARSMDGTARFWVSLTATAAAWAGRGVRQPGLAAGRAERRGAAGGGLRAAPDRRRAPARGATGMPGQPAGRSSRRAPDRGGPSSLDRRDRRMRP